MRSLPPLPVTLRMRCSPLWLVIADAQPHKFADAATGIGEDGEHGPVAAIDRRLLLRLFHWGALSKRRQ